MKIGKLVAFVLFFIFFCGFKVDYDILISDKLELDENVKFYFEIDNSDFVKTFNMYIPVDKDDGNYISDIDKFDDIDYYKIEKDSSFSALNFNFKHTMDSMNTDFFSNYCYRYVTVIKNYNEDEERDELLISTSKNFLCFENETNLESVTIKIHTDREVYDHNADIVDDGVYIWNITESNKNDATINIVMDASIVKTNISFWEKNLLFIISLVLFLIGVIIYLILKRYSKKVNKV